MFVIFLIIITYYGKGSENIFSDVQRIRVLVFTVFVMCECVYVWIVYCVGVCMYGLCNVWVCVCAECVMCGCV